MDKPWINLDLKKLHRQKSREYNKNGKSSRYINLLKEFKSKFKTKAAKYI